MRLCEYPAVRPFLHALSSHSAPPIRIAHRFVESIAQLSNYTSYPDGLLWRDPETFNAPVFYLSFHGSPGALRSSLEKIDARKLCEAFEDFGGKYRNLVHFGACSVLAGRAGRRFARDFLAASRCRAVLGYTTDIDWMDSMVTDLLFLRRFFNDTDPWKNIRRIHRAVLADFAPARRLGYELHTHPT